MITKTTLDEIISALKLKSSRLNANIRVQSSKSQFSEFHARSFKELLPAKTILLHGQFGQDDDKEIKIQNLGKYTSIDELPAGTIVEFKSKSKKISYGIVKKSTTNKKFYQKYLSLLSKKPKHLHKYYRGVEVNSDDFIISLIIDPIKDLIIRIGLFSMTIIIFYKIIETIYYSRVM